MNQGAGKYLSLKMANHRPITKQQMLQKWPKLGSIYIIDQGIEWIEAATTTSDNPFLFCWDNREPKWGFRSTWGEVSLNLSFNVSYLITRTETLQRVIDHAIASPVVTMTPTEKRAAKALSAQAGGTIAFLHSIAAALP